MVSAIAHHTSVIAGNYIAFLAALILIAAWAVSGPIFHYSKTRQLVINTTTIITSPMVFLIQNTQNRDAMAMHLKLDECIRAIDKADNITISTEDETDRTREELKRDYEHLCQEQDGNPSRVRPAPGR